MYTELNGCTCMYIQVSDALSFAMAIKYCKLLASLSLEHFNWLTVKMFNSIM